MQNISPVAIIASLPGIHICSKRMFVLSEVESLQHAPRLPIAPPGVGVRAARGIDFGGGRAAVGGADDESLPDRDAARRDARH